MVFGHGARAGPRDRGARFPINVSRLAAELAGTNGERRAGDGVPRDRDRLFRTLVRAARRFRALTGAPRENPRRHASHLRALQEYPQRQGRLGADGSLHLAAIGGRIFPRHLPVVQRQALSRSGVTAGRAHPHSHLRVTTNHQPPTESAKVIHYVRVEDLTTGSITRHLLKTTGFMLVTMVFQTLYFLVDLYWVGRLGKEAIAGVGIAGNLSFIVLAITQMLGVGTTSLISQAAGRKEREQAQLVLTQSLLLSGFIGALFLIVATALRESYVTSLSPDPVSAAAATAYLSWFIPAMALQFPMVVMAAALRGTGNFKPGMVVQTATVIINIVLAPALMFGWIGTPPMGVAGAGLASFVAIIVGTIWLAFYFFEAASYLTLHPHFKPHG